MMPWRKEENAQIMLRLRNAQNKDTGVDYMTMAGFMDTDEDLHAYVKRIEDQVNCAINER